MPASVDGSPNEDTYSIGIQTSFKEYAGGNFISEPPADGGVPAVGAEPGPPRAAPLQRRLENLAVHHCCAPRSLASSCAKLISSMPSAAMRSRTRGSHNVRSSTSRSCRYEDSKPSPM